MILGGLLGLSALQLVVGGLWDASQPLTTGEIPGGSECLWPSHLVIYSSFLVSLSVARIAMAGVIVPAWRAGMRDPRQWARRSPELARSLWPRSTSGWRSRETRRGTSYSASI
jgi:hypothetical protein